MKNNFFVKMLSLCIPVILLSACSAAPAGNGASTKEVSTIEAIEVMDTPAVSQPEKSQTEASPSDVSKPEASKTEASKPEVSKPEVSKPEASKPEVSKPEASKPEASKPEASKLEASKTEASKPEISKPETSKPEVSKAPPAAVDVTGVTINPTEMSIPVNHSFRIETTLSPDNATKTKYVWHVSDLDIIDLQSDGTVTGKAVGTATITAETYNGLTAVCTVTVTEPPPPPPPPSGKTVSAEWFDDAVFLGDSVTNTLSMYADNGCLGDAEFIPSVGIGYHSALWSLNYKGNVHPLYYGKKMLMEDAAQKSGRKKIFIMLGMNDIGGWGVDSTVDAMREFTSHIEQKCPGSRIYIQSLTPMIASMKRTDMLNNKNIALFNEKAKAFCEERGYVFLDVASAVSDGQGNLLPEYCFDPNYMGMHFTNSGCQKWVDYLKEHVG